MCVHEKSWHETWLININKKSNPYFNESMEKPFASLCRDFVSWSNNQIIRT